MTSFMQAGFAPWDGELPPGPLGGTDGFPTTEPERCPYGEQAISTVKKTPTIIVFPELLSPTITYFHVHGQTWV